MRTKEILAPAGEDVGVVRVLGRGIGCRWSRSETIIRVWVIDVDLTGGN